ncbi:MAG: PDZ domain-containing protein, partial [Acidobacteriota bacterium]
AHDLPPVGQAPLVAIARAAALARRAVAAAPPTPRPAPGVRGGGTGADAGVRAEDLLLRVDGQAIQSGDALNRYLRSLPQGREVVLELLRQNRPHTLRFPAP